MVSKRLPDVILSPFPLSYAMVEAQQGEASRLVVGLGIDLVELSRVRRSLEQWGDRLLAKIMSPSEIARLPPAGPLRVEAVALAIAGKEAAAKAIGTGWSRGVFWRDVEVVLGSELRIRLHGQAMEAARHLGSRGECRLGLETQAGLAVGEVHLLA